MKTIFTFIILSLLFFNKTNAQDTIIKKNGDSLIVKVVDINDKEIKYKKFTNIDGPTYIENKSEVKTIKYATGLREEITVIQKQKETELPSERKTEYVAPPEISNKIDGYGNHFVYHNQPINEKEMQTILVATQNGKIITLVQQAQKAKGLQNIGYAAIPFGVGATIAIPYWMLCAIGYNNNWGLPYTRSERNKYGAIAALCVVGTITCPIASGVFSAHKKNCNLRAVQLYNQSY